MFCPDTDVKAFAIAVIIVNHNVQSPDEVSITLEDRNDVEFVVRNNHIERSAQIFVINSICQRSRHPREGILVYLIPVLSGQIISRVSRDGTGCAAGGLRQGQRVDVRACGEIP